MRFRRSLPGPAEGEIGQPFPLFRRPIGSTLSSRGVSPACDVLVTRA